MRHFGSFPRAFTVAFVLVQSLAPARAGDFDEGVKLYQANSFKSALPYFEKAARDFPTSRQVRFYLGHTYFALGKMTAARSQYEFVQNSAADAAVKTQAQDALSEVCKYLGTAPPSPVAASSAAGAASNSRPKAGVQSIAGKGKGDDDEEDEEEEQQASGNDDRSRRLEALKESIRKVAQAEVAKIKQEAKEKLEHEKRQANQFWVYSDGSMGVDIEPERKTELEKECAQRCKQVMDEAERRIKNLK